MTVNNTYYQELARLENERDEAIKMHLSLQQTLDCWQKHIRRLQSEKQAAEQRVKDVEQERDAALNERNAARRVADDRYQHGWDTAVLALRKQSEAAEAKIVSLREALESMTIGNYCSHLSGECCVCKARKALGWDRRSKQAKP